MLARLGWNGNTALPIQGGRSCAKARRAYAEKFGPGRKFEALTYAIKICRDLRIFRKTFWGQKQRVLGKSFTITWYIVYIVLN